MAKNLSQPSKGNRVAQKDEPTCQNFLTYTVRNGPGKIVGIILAFVLSHLLHHLLKPLSQPRISSDIIIGLVIGSIPWIREAFDENFITTLNFIAEFGMICYMFALGMEMDPYTIFRPPTQPTMIAYAGIISSFIIACTVTPYLRYFRDGNQYIGLTLSLSLTLSGSSSHILTRIITNLKIGKSDIGKLIIGAGVHSDMVTMLLLTIHFLIFAPITKGSNASARITDSVTMSAALLLQTIFAAKISPIFLGWVNNENPEGKPMKGSHLVLSIAFMVMVCSASPLYGFNPILSAFMAGIFLPSEGRVSKWAVGKLNYLLTTLFFPVFFFWMGYHANLRKLHPGHLGSWGRFFAFLGITWYGKVVGTVVCGAILGYQWRESVEIGLLLSAKGHFHIFLAVIMNLVMFLASYLTICLRPNTSLHAYCP